ncbi:Serine/threonine-protein phosphatase 7 long form like [Dendrobium catenatum]|uniref:Serine/threonine-protein phosphatase 7 long form like n=1 Tax=Dendrobium catenatum TaxID=906689 RepID=A0A2I0W4X4_9ASPA|nr:Serine/threonine-protein phosphatase 7 long form like [Dendrobium catenatum]
MVHEWPVNCPRFMDALRLVGLDCVSQMRYLRMDHHLLTALVERWSPQTNSFHLTVGEMTITLQEVAMILGVHIDGPALVGHVRAYIFFILGCHLLPDTSGSEIHLQYLTIMEDLVVFNTYSLGGAILAHLYRELGEATQPSRANIAGCIHLLQIWAWEHLHVGRPIWQSYTPDIGAQVAQICLSGEDIWTARVPLISWKRVEWHLPDRVLRQFGLCPTTNIEPMDPSFKRVDGRGKPDMDWMLYHQAHISIWESRRGYIVTGDLLDQHNNYSIH